ncbi:MAG: hypothetical protein OSA11_06035 [Candidatus Nanopelagicales bacterium]|nr:hypothetical protein [Candidatus Nanopelagicales bacterium]
MRVPTFEKLAVGPRTLIAGVLGGVTSALALVIILTVILSASDSANPGAEGYAPLAYSAFAIVLAAVIVGAFVRRVRIHVSAVFAWIVGAVSFAVSFVPWWGLTGGNPDLGVLIYRGLKVPQGIIQFWDLSLIMQSVDCARWGFDIYAKNNGCLADPSIYAPGMVWLRFIPFDVFSKANVAVLGAIMIVISSLMLVSLAKSSGGIGQIVFLIAAVGGPWLLLLERGNIDAVILWVAVVSALLVSKIGLKSGSDWRVLWPWVVAAMLIWIVGTWKYYPFALGLMLLPALRIKRGWIVVVGFGMASLAYVIATWANFQFSAQANSSMVDYGDFVVLGRIPVAARMLEYGDVLFFVLAVTALTWGFLVGRSVMRLGRFPYKKMSCAMLAAGGSALYLVSVLISGFGYGYKAVFLLLAIPLLSLWVGSPTRSIAASSLLVIIFVAIESFVVWNTVLATTVGIVAAAFSLGAAGPLLFEKRARSAIS